MLKKLLYAIVIVIVIFSVVGLFLPRNIHIERSISIDQPAPMLFAILNSYASYDTWSPWAARGKSQGH